MELLFDRVAGLDVGEATLTVCLRTPGPSGRWHAETRTFKTTTGSLRVMRNWLVEAGVQIAATESTSTFKGELMALQAVGRAACMFVGHRWRVEHHRATQGTEEDCLRCGTHRSTFPGATEATLRRRPTRGEVSGSQEEEETATRATAI